MGLYDIVLGDGRQQQRGELLLSVLGTTAPAQVARFRDAWVERGADGHPVIAIYTRTGGGNRECFCAEHGRGHPSPECYLAVNEDLARHPLYLRDADDRFDATYATFYFRVPGVYQEALSRVAVDHVDMSMRWREAIARVERGELRPAEVALGDQFAAFVTDPGPAASRVMEV